MATQCHNSTNSRAYSAEDTDIHTVPAWITASMVLVGVLTIVVNIPAIIAVVLTKIKNNNFRNMHLVSLGITDILAGVSLFPLLIISIQPNVKTSYWSCHARFMFFALAYFNSIGQVSVICIDRFCLLLKPSWRFTSKYEHRLFKIIGSMVLLTLMLTCFTFFGLGNPQEHNIICKLDILFCNNFDFFSAITGMFAICIECFTIASCILMIVILQRHRRKWQQVAPANRHALRSVNPCVQGGRTQSQSAKMTAEAKSTVTIIMIITIFVICITPLNLGFIMQGLHLVAKTSRTTRCVFITLSCLNSAVNPFIYCFRTPEVRNTLHSWLGNLRSLFLD